MGEIREVKPDERSDRSLCSTICSFNFTLVYDRGYVVI